VRGFVLFLIVGSVGVLLEGMQALKYGIALEIHDVAANVTGALIGTLVAKALSSAVMARVEEAPLTER
jgi:glycopeptide antibiotics resistance protein